jgi:hypothetical protein
VIWDLSLIALDAKTCQFTNLVTTYATNDFLDGLQAAGQTFEQVAASLQAAVSDHNRRETPLFAASIERRALAAPKHSTT